MTYELRETIEKLRQERNAALLDAERYKEERNRVYARVRRELQEPQALLPMSEAPRDGSPVLLARGKGFVSAGWDADEKVWLADPEDEDSEMICENEVHGWLSMPEVHV